MCSHSQFFTAAHFHLALENRNSAGIVGLSLTKENTVTLVISTNCLYDYTKL